MVNRLMMGSSTTGAPKHMAKSNGFYANARQIGVVDIERLGLTGTRSCSAYLESGALLASTRLNRGPKLTDAADYLNERQGMPLLWTWRQDSRGIFEGEDSFVTRDIV